MEKDSKVLLREEKKKKIALLKEQISALDVYIHEKLKKVEKRLHKIEVQLYVRGVNPSQKWEVFILRDDGCTIFIGAFPTLELAKKKKEEMKEEYFVCCIKIITACEGRTILYSTWNQHRDMTTYCLLIK
jgi:hypothetical protein